MTKQTGNGQLGTDSEARAAVNGGNGQIPPRFTVETDELEEPRRRKSVFENLEAHKIAEEDEGDASEEVLASIPVRRPSRKDFIRAHPEYQFTAYVYEDDKAGETYYVAPSMRALLIEETVAKKVVLVPYQNRRGTLFFWAITTTDRGDWHSSAMKIVHEARSKWVRIRSDQERACYIWAVAKRIYEEPQWPDKGLSELLISRSPAVTSTDRTTKRSTRSSMAEIREILQRPDIQSLAPSRPRTSTF
jgi:hypothetical protein